MPLVLSGKTEGHEGPRGEGGQDLWSVLQLPPREKVAKLLLTRVALGVTAAVRAACAPQMVDGLLQARHAHSHSYPALVSTEGYLLKQHDFNASHD